MAALSASLKRLLREQQLPECYRRLISDYFIPLSDHIAERKRRQASPLVVGINGSQGSGKTTLCLFLTVLLRERHSLITQTLALDDFYLSRSRREQLARQYHPLFKIRGVPGSHDIDLAINTLTSLQQGRPTVLPRFSKAGDDLLPKQQWPTSASKVDIIFLEGWCVGAQSQAAEALQHPVNALERDEDSEGHWRSLSNQWLAGDYQRLFAMIDYLVMLQAPGMDAVLDWRCQQEQQLRAKTTGPAAGLMSEAQIKRFIQHYQRLTEAMLAEMPARADVLLSLSEDHLISHACGLPPVTM